MEEMCSSETSEAACFHTGFLLGLFLDPEDEGDMFLRNVKSACLHADFLLGLFFDPEDGGDMFLRNVG
jgi:hypothetical protein